MKSLISFIDEGAEDKTEKYKVVVLTRQPKDKPEQKLLATARKFEEAAKSLKMESYTVFIEGAYISFVDSVRRIHNVDDEEGFEISQDDTLIIVRGGVNARDSWKDLLSQLERAGYACSNSSSPWPSATKLCSNSTSDLKVHFSVQL